MESIWAEKPVSLFVVMISTFWGGTYADMNIPERGKR